MAVNNCPPPNIYREEFPSQFSRYAGGNARQLLSCGCFKRVRGARARAWLVLGRHRLPQTSLLTSLICSLALRPVAGLAADLVGGCSGQRSRPALTDERTHAHSCTVAGTSFDQALPQTLVHHHIPFKFSQTRHAQKPELQDDGLGQRRLL